MPSTDLKKNNFTSQADNSFHRNLLGKVVNPTEHTQVMLLSPHEMTARGLTSVTFMQNL